MTNELWGVLIGGLIGIIILIMVFIVVSYVNNRQFSQWKKSQKIKYLKENRDEKQLYFSTVGKAVNNINVSRDANYEAGRNIVKELYLFPLDIGLFEFCAALKNGTPGDELENIGRELIVKMSKHLREIDKEIKLIQ